MAKATISQVRLRGIASAVPATVRTLGDDAKAFGEEEVRKVSENTGVKERRIAPAGMCASDLCFAAANRLIIETGWDRNSIDALILVTQTPDYILPATSCILQTRLGLSNSCAAFDVNLGCSGYVYGTWLAASLISGGMRRVMLLVGETANRSVSPQDRSVALLFGDCGTASLFERDETAAPMTFILGTDGKGCHNLIIPAGSYRRPHSAETGRRTTRENNNLRSDEDLFMNGAEIFAFTLREVPFLVKSVMAEAAVPMECIDCFVFHQANKFVLDHLGKKIKIPPERLPLILDKYGNTSSASIPLTISERLSPRLSREGMKLLLAGFGVGYSWGAVVLDCGPMIAPPVFAAGSECIGDGVERREA